MAVHSRSLITLVPRTTLTQFTKLVTEESREWQQRMNEGIKLHTVEDSKSV